MIYNKKSLEQLKLVLQKQQNIIKKANIDISNWRYMQEQQCGLQRRYSSEKGTPKGPANRIEKAIIEIKKIEIEILEKKNEAL